MLLYGKKSVRQMFLSSFTKAFALAPRMYFTKDKLGIVCDVCKNFKGENLFCQG